MTHIILGVEYEFEGYRYCAEYPAFGPIRDLFHRTWVAEQSNIMDLSDTLVARTSGEPLVHQKNAIDPLSDRFFLRVLYRTFVMRKRLEISQRGYSLSRISIALWAE